MFILVYGSMPRSRKDMLRIRAEWWRRNSTAVRNDFVSREQCMQRNGCSLVEWFSVAICIPFCVFEEGSLTSF